MIVAATIKLAQNLLLHIVAEGVTKPKQASFLEANGCTAAQGNFLAGHFHLFNCVLSPCPKQPEYFYALTRDNRE